MKISGLLLDVEGVLVADKRYQAVETAVEFIRTARDVGCPLRLITNNTTDPRPVLHEKLARAGFDFELGELHTCTAASITHLKQLNVNHVLVLGNAALRAMFEDAGLHVVDDSKVDAVVVGMDTDLTYERLVLACGAVYTHHARFIALHHNRLYTDAQGRIAPSVGSLSAAIEYATQAPPTIIGKPSSAYFQQALDELGIPPTDVLVVSDDPLTDLAGAKRMGMNAAFVLSGKYSDESVLEQIPPAERPDHVAPRIGDLLTQSAVSF